MLRAILPSSMPGSKVRLMKHPFVITVYVECETAEELEEVTADEEIEQDKRSRNDFLEPVEINL
jgi:KaiC/GvpD/RAD55 family RecA-like ATPase